MSLQAEYIRWFEELNKQDIPLVGGKNASLGEMVGALRPAGIKVPPGFATTAAAYRYFLSENGLDEKIPSCLEGYHAGDISLHQAGETIRRLIRRGRWPRLLKEQISGAYHTLCQRCGEELAVAVRSSATAEDLPDASFAGQQETYLNICGDEELLDACRMCFASLYTDRAIVYRGALR